MKIKEIRMMTRESLRQLCMNNGWYTKGDCNAYENLMQRTEQENLTTEDIVEMAEDIAKHSVQRWSLTASVLNLRERHTQCLKKNEGMTIS